MIFFAFDPQVGMPPPHHAVMSIHRCNVQFPTALREDASFTGNECVYVAFFSLQVSAAETEVEKSIA